MDGPQSQEQSPREIKKLFGNRDRPTHLVQKKRKFDNE